MNRRQIGMVDDAEDDKVKKLLNNSKNPNYEEALKAAKIKKSLTDWSTFRRVVMLPAIDEINKKSDINIEFEPLRGGVGGKVKGVRFNIQYKQDKEIVEVIDKVLSEDEKMDFIFELKGKLLKYDLKAKDLRTIAEKSNFDMDKCENAIEILNNAKGGIDNVVGFLVQAIDKEWEIRQKKKDFANFDQRDEDWNAIVEGLKV